jgi:hypothetical protein
MDHEGDDDRHGGSDGGGLFELDTGGDIEQSRHVDRHGITAGREPFTYREPDSEPDRQPYSIGPSVWYARAAPDTLAGEAASRDQPLLL